MGMVGICVRRLIEADEETGQVLHFVQCDALISLNATCVLPVIQFNSKGMRLWEVTACKCAPLLIKVGINLLPAPPSSTSGWHWAPDNGAVVAQSSCCSKPISQEQRFCAMAAGLAWATDVSPSSVMSRLPWLWCHCDVPEHCIGYAIRKLHGLGRCYQWFVCGVQKWMWNTIAADVCHGNQLFHAVSVISLLPFGWCTVDLSSQSCMILHRGARITSTQELLHLGESVHKHVTINFFYLYIAFVCTLNNLFVCNNHWIFTF